ncbi:SusD/RagB family nutrient-binding outer membrane lipoprotein [Sphingobacterium sp. UT-1RO-CII-1]|uniref:SusD/RagB family nutrient-binding outer membrane lipoprotein n=1 Tax=Sphingobacterium sp. UT-1RO-CII-1 TaxID=2995225 RepID=UPI00227B4DA9|nr:SusD/RagB family nutrient-binding outer membrane lipoprotein [Sphingobacterium sp. UT-1RO-CII-1]MCY4780262.1 SusD/RagB family nutrient-binding outer membrane lipoprotein [Sphingobacterium sp. UT-1RO-CII-1]
MNIIIFYIKKVLLSILLLSLISCSDFDDLNTDPDGSTKASRSLLATNVILNLTSSSSGKTFYSNQLVSKYLAWAENADGNQYNSFGRTGFGDYAVIINGEKMLEMTIESNRSAYEGLYFFAKAYKMFYLTMSLGDIPYSEAFRAEEGLTKPKYDTQKEVLIAVLDNLDKAYAEFSKSGKLEGDPVYQGDVNKWRVLTRAMQLKILMQLSIKENDTDLKIAERFKQYAATDLMTSNADNFQRTYSSVAKEYYPIYYTRLNHNPYAMLSDLLIDKLKETEDVRLFYYGKPSTAKLAQGVTEDDFEAYVGINPSISFDEIKDRWGAGDFSGINSRYTHHPSGEPVVKVGYSEQQFILAEAALRGWISGAAKDYYSEGIRASMKFIDDNTVDDVKFHHGRKITEGNIVTAVEHVNNKLTGEFEKDLELIIYQKYVSSFMQREWDAYYDYRRTGYPKFPINPSTNQNTINTKMPVRWMYPESEYGHNSQNVNQAVKNQWNGIDDVNQVMWILQK